MLCGRLMVQVSFQYLAGDPDAISKVAGREDLNNFDGLDKSENLQLLNLT